MSRDKSWIQTRFGHRAEILGEFNPGQFKAEEIGAALSKLCRFTGHVSAQWDPDCSKIYSVAEHCVRVSFRCEELVFLRDKDNSKHCPCILTEDMKRAAKYGLLHDSPEAFVNDINRPLKHQPELTLYREIENRLLKAILEQHGLTYPLPEYVHVADDELLWTEARDIMSPLHNDWKSTAKSVREPLAHVTIAGWSPGKAYRMFMARYRELFGAQ